MSGDTGALQRVSRMLQLVPYIARRPGISVAELAADFAVSPAQIQSDLTTLMMCGEPGYYPDQLIDVIMDESESRVSIGYDAGITHTVRLSPREAITLTAALQALAATPGLHNVDAVQSALAKVVAVSDPDAAALRIEPEPSGESWRVVQQALEQHRRLRITYYTASRDAVSSRQVDPIRLLTMDGWTYVEAYCYQAEAVRRFRLDRIDQAVVLDIPAQEVLWVDEQAPSTLFHPRADTPQVTVRMARSAAWVAEYYQCEILDTDPATGVIVARIPGTSDEWIIRLVLSLGGEIEIVDRPDLAAAVRRRAHEALAQYADATLRKI